jgi:predicted transcriptional regulator
MNPTPETARNLTWEAIQGRLTGARLSVYSALNAEGRPLTTRALAAAAGLDLLTVRPRVTELVDLGLAECTGHEAHEGRHEGLYRAVPLHLARAAHDARHAADDLPLFAQERAHDR